MNSDQYVPVNLALPGRRTRKIVKTSKGAVLAVLSFLSFTVGLPVALVNGSAAPISGPLAGQRADASPLVREVGADSAADLRLPKTVLSTVDSLMDAGGVFQTSRDDLTIYNLALKMRLRGGLNHHDELLGPGLRSLGYSFWSVEADLSGNWTRLLPSSRSLAVVGTNRTGSYVVRTERVSSSSFSGLFQVAYKATSSGPLKYDLFFTPAAAGHYRLTYTWGNLSSDYSLSDESRRFWVNYGVANYTLLWNDVPASMNSSASVESGLFLLRIDLGLLGRGSRVIVDPQVISGVVPTSPDATSFTFQRKVFYEPKGGYYFVFYYNGYSIVYRYSRDGTSWSDSQPMPSGWPAYYDAPSSSPFVLSSGTTVVVSAGEKIQTTFSCPSTPCRGRGAVSLYYAIGTVTGSNISWLSYNGNQVFTGAFMIRMCANSVVLSCSLTLATRNVSVGLTSQNRLVFSFNFHADGAVTNGEGDSVCVQNAQTESDVAIAYGGAVGLVDCENGSAQRRSVILPGDSNGNMRLVYEFHTGSKTQLKTVLVGTQDVTSQFTASADAYIRASNPNTNFGATSFNNLYLEAPASGTSFESDVLVQFQPNLPAGAMVKNANLTLTMYNNGSGGNVTLNVFVPSSAWAESTVTYNSFYTSLGVPLIGSLSSRNLTMSSLVAGTQYVLDVSGQLRGMAFGSWSDNGLFIWLDPVPNCPGCLVPGVNFDSRESGTSTSPKLSVAYVCCIGIPQVLEANEDSAGQFSAAIDTDYGTHVVFQGGTDGNVTYAYLPAGGSWVFSPRILNLCHEPSQGGCWDSDPTITIDYSTNEVYVFAIETPPPVMGGPSVIMKHKSLSENWSEVFLQTIANDGFQPSNLGSNMVSASGTNSSWLSVVWTFSSSPYYVHFESIPIQTVWSPFASPSDPWDGYGVAPYGQYFQNLGEYVSTSTGLLSIRQTQLSLSGRGLSLDITLIYTEPYSFLAGAAYDFETYPWAPLGSGWQLNFPWMSSMQNPKYIHLWNGQGYRIPSGFWSGSASVFENHQGEHFTLKRNGTDIILYSKSGLSYRFDPVVHTLTRVADPSENSISFDYSNSKVSKITDTVGRTFLFCYGSDGKLARIDQASGDCNSETKVRGVTFAYGQGWFNATDPAGRVTSYQYGGSADPNVSVWLVSRIHYPTGWYTSYSYSPTTIGTDAKTYRITAQTVATSQGTTVKRYDYSYNNGPGGPVSSSTVTAYNGTQIAGYTDYSFSFAGVFWNVSDATHSFVRGVHQLFGVGGDVTREDILVSQTQSYTNYYSYDPWGNQIYSHRVINPSAGWTHEGFNAYYNNGLSPSFAAFQETFGQANFTGPNNHWFVNDGIWLVKDGVYNGTWSVGTNSDASMFAWADVGKKDASIKAQVYVSNALSPNLSDIPRIGLFVHYPGTGTSKWALTIHDWIGETYALELVNDPVDGSPFVPGWLGNSQPTARNSCSSWTIPLLSHSVWYTFNMTIRGNSATGWVSAPGQPACSVSGTFPSVNSALDGTGFGLYSGGYPSLFDNVTVVTVSPQITTTGFSNAFTSNGTPRSTVHGALAATAELQNGTNTFPIETYYSYYSWGGLKETRQRYDSPNTQWLTTSMAYDSYGNLARVTDSRGNSTDYSYGLEYEHAYLTSQTHLLKPGSTTLTTSFTYDRDTGSLLSATDPLGFVASYEYDILGRATRTTYPQGQGFETYVYNDTANYVEMTNQHGRKVRQYYDGLGRLTRVERLGIISAKLRMYNTDSSNRGGDFYKTSTSWSESTVTWNTAPPTEGAMTASLGSVSTGSPWYEVDVTPLVTGDGALSLKITSPSTDLAEYSSKEGANPPQLVVTFNNQGQTSVLTFDPTDDAYVDSSKATTNYGSKTTLKVYSPAQNFLLRFSLTGIGSPSYSNQTSTYDWANRVTATTDSAGNTWRAEYDALGRTVKTTKPDQLQTQTVYNDLASWVLNVNEENVRYCRISDRLGRLISVVENASADCSTGTVSNYYYDEVGNLVKVVNSNAQPTSHTHDNLNRLTSTYISDPVWGNLTESYSYDAAGNAVRKADRNSALTLYAYDSLNRLLTVDYCVTPFTSDNYTYDRNGNTVQIESQNATLTYTYDARNRVLSETYAVNSGSTFVDIGCPGGGGGGGGSVAYGTLIALADRTAIPVQNLKEGMRLLSYDTEKAQYTTSSITSIEVVTTTNMLVIKTEDPLPLRVDNATAQKLWVRQNDGHTGWLSVTKLRVGDDLFNAIDQRWTKVLEINYAPRGVHVMYDIYTTAPYNYIANNYLDPQKYGPTAETATSGGVSQTYTINYTYNGDSLSSMTYPDGRDVRYSYDRMGRMRTVFTAGGPVYASLNYTQDDRVKSIRFGNGLIGDYTYDNLSRPSTAKLKNGVTELLSLSYNYNRTGTVASIIGAVNGVQVEESYRYDSLQRLINSALVKGGTATTLSYVYDSLGNRIRQTENGAITSYSYNLGNQLTNSSAPGTTIRYYYDRNGNLNTRDLSGQIWTYDYDTVNHLLRVRNGSVTQGQYAYDGMGRRVESVESSRTSFYAYLGTETLYEKVSGGPTTDFVFAGTRIANVSGTSVSYYHPDHLGSTRLVTSASGAVVFADNYQPFGKDNGTPSCTGSCETYKFTGKPYSSATGLYYNFQRWYDPEVGRFISQDPILGSLSYPQTQNRYTYTINNPVQYTDPSGEIIPLLVILAVGIIFAGVGLAATLSPELAQYTDPAMTLLGMVPVLGDFTGDPYFAARDVSSCALGRGCDQFQTGLDIAVLLPIIPGALGRTKRIANLVDATTDLGRAGNRAEDALGALKYPGRLGDDVHKARVAGIVADIEARKLIATTEFAVRNQAGKIVRYADVAALDPATRLPQEMYQVGLMTKRGLPVSREIEAIVDIQGFLGMDVRFIPKYLP